MYLDIILHAFKIIKCASFLLFLMFVEQIITFILVYIENDFLKFTLMEYNGNIIL